MAWLQGTLMKLLDRLPLPGRLDGARYWDLHNVSGHRRFSSRQESVDYLEWRNAQYLGYARLMPCGGFDGKAILDYGCGPGNDLAGFLEYSKPRRLAGADISKTALAQARQRSLLHGGGDIELHRIGDSLSPLPFPDSAFDYIHCSGVLHHTPDPQAVLGEFRRMLKPDGLVRIMVYHYHSIWVHLYVAYLLQIRHRTDARLTLAEAFRRSTDGRSCPISRFYRKDEFISLCRLAGFDAHFSGTAVALHEMNVLPLRYRAMQDQRLNKEHRDFLAELTLDESGLPHYGGDAAGIDGVYELHPT
jgi:ubiquinone/menaquinone biosynthesis C-methylase UbiE